MRDQRSRSRVFAIRGLPSSRRGRRAVAIVTAVGAGLALALLVLQRDPSDGGRSSDGRLRVLTAPPSGEPMSPLECEAEGYPCSLGEVDDAVWSRSMELGMLAAERFAAGGPDAAGEWLRSQPEVVSVRLGPEVAGFRLDGGRYTWVGPPPAATPEPVRTTGLPARSWWSRLLALGVPSVHAQVVGQDQNGDGKLNQRDFRRALIVDKESHTLEDFRSILEASPFYSGHVTVRNTHKKFPEHNFAPPFGWQDFLGWQNFDLIHVRTPGISTCAVFSDAVAPSPGWVGRLRGILGALTEREGDDRAEPAVNGGNCQLRGLFTGDRFEGAHTDTGMPARYRRLLGAEDRALDMQIWTEETGKDARSSMVFVLVTPDFFGQVYGNLRSSDSGELPMDRRLVLVDADYAYDTTRTLYERIFGPVRRSLLIARVGDMVGNPDLMLEFYRHLVSGYGGLESAILQTDTLNYLWGLSYDHRGSSVRAREIVTLIDEDGEPLRDYMELPTRGEPDDGRNDFITLLRAKVVGLWPEELGNHMYLNTAVAWLEVDGNFVGREVSLAGQPTDGDTVTVRFEDVPLGFDLEADKVYDVDVVVKLQGASEDSESRYSVILSPPFVGGYRFAVTGPVALPELSGRYVARQMHVIVGVADDRAGPVPGLDFDAGLRDRLSPLPALTITLSAGTRFVEGANAGLVSMHFREHGYTCAGYGGSGFELTLASLTPLEGAFEGRVTCTPGRLDDSTHFRDSLRQRVEAHATGRFRGR